MTENTSRNEIGKSSRLRIILLSFVVTALWGSLFPFVKLGYIEFGLDTANPANLLLFAGVRFFISGLLLSVFCMGKSRTFRILERRTFGSVMLVGLFAVALHYACTYIGLANIDSSTTALLKQSGVLVFVCFSFLVFKEDRFTVQKLIGAALGLFSILIVNMDALKIRFNVWTLLIIGASICTVISNVIYKKLLNDVPALTSTGVSQLTGGIILMAAGFLSGGRITVCTPAALLVFGYIITATVVSYSLWYSVVKKYELSKLFIIKMAEPLFAALVSLALPLGAKITWNHLIAFVLVFAAVLISNMKPKERRRYSHESNVSG